MKIAVFNKFWQTGGGGEKYGGTIAELLAREHDVDLLVDEPFDAAWLGERLQLDLAALRQVEVGSSRRAVAEASEGYDLFVNVTYMSSDRSRARHGIYIVYFPTSIATTLPPAVQAASRTVDALRQGRAVPVDWGEGFHLRDAGPRAPMWTDGDAMLHLAVPPSRTVPVELSFSHQRPAATLPDDITVEVDGRAVASATLRPPRSKVDAVRGLRIGFSVTGHDDGSAVDVRLRSGWFVPAEVAGGGDRRRLGVPVRSVRVGNGPLSRLQAALPDPPVLGVRPGWVDSYDRLVSISEYTRHWVRRSWDAESDLLWPPVTQYEAASKERQILSVGRFFEAHQGHSKKQLEMVRAFRALCDDGLRGWSLHLVGGCAPEAESYLEQVRAAAAGYPVELHVNAPGAELTRLYGTASIYWHATGLGERLDRHPHRLEHFGITTVEAMSAGAVPVVFAGAGQLETVRHGIDGFHFRHQRDLVALTRLLVDDERTARRMALQARARARDFAVEAFDARLRSIVDDVVTGDRR